MTDILSHIHPRIRQGASPEQWADYKWQLKHSFTRMTQLEGIMSLTASEQAAALAGAHHLAFRVTPYWMSLLQLEDVSDPLRLQLIPRIEEWSQAAEECSDPLQEQKHMVLPGLVHRYPDRVLLLATQACAGYCRYCTRSRLVSGGGGEGENARLDMDAVCAYLKEHREVRDVLISGGDPLLLSDTRLDYILGRLSEVEHIEVLRLGTRIPLMLPQRVTENLAKILQRYAPLYLFVHCNHARELSPESRRALGLLCDHGIPLGSQSVLLRGVNDTNESQRELYHALLRARVKPYYLYHCDRVRGTQHFRTDLGKGIEIMESLRGHTSGFAIPQYVLDAPDGGGKIALNPQSIVERGEGYYVLKNYKGQELRYTESTEGGQNAH